MVYETVFPYNVRWLELHLGKALEEFSVSMSGAAKHYVIKQRQNIRRQQIKAGIPIV